VAGAALATLLMAFVDWTCPTTTMFMDTFSAPIFDFGWFRGMKYEVKTES